MREFTVDEKRKYLRVIYAAMMRYFSIALILCAVIAGLYRSRMHFVFALCAIAGIFILWGWVAHLKSTGFNLIGFGELSPKKKKIPYMLKKRGESKFRHRPFFAIKSDSFDDDLTDKTSISSEEFSEGQRNKAAVIARVLCGILLLLVSLMIGY